MKSRLICIHKPKVNKNFFFGILKKRPGFLNYWASEINYDIVGDESIVLEALEAERYYERDQLIESLNYYVRSHDITTNFIFSSSLFSFVTEIFIGFAVLQVLVAEIIQNSKTPNTKPTNLSLARSNKFNSIGILVSLLSLILLLNSGLCSIDLAPKMTEKLNCFFTVLPNSYIENVLKAILLISLFLFFFASNTSNEKHSLNNSFEYFSFVLSSMLGSLLICSSKDLLSSYLALELQSVSFYFMACSNKSSAHSISSGFKYFTIGSFASILYLYGSCLVYGVTGTLNFYDIADLMSVIITDPIAIAGRLETNSYDPILASIGLAKARVNVPAIIIQPRFSIKVGCFFICVGLLIKLASAPFHHWSLDVYESSSNRTVYFFAITSKIGLFALMSKVVCSLFKTLFANNTFFNPYTVCFIAFSTLSVVVGSLGGLKQTKIKSIIAYSSISHTGYILLFLFTGTEESVALMLFYIIVYTFSTANFCFILMVLKPCSKFYSQKRNRELSSLASLHKTNPTLSIAVLISVLSLAGIPPFAGFIIKFNLFYSLFHSTIYVVPLTCVIFSAISTFYYLRVVKVIYFENLFKPTLYEPIKRNGSLAIAVLSFFLVFLLLNPTLTYLITQKASLLLF